MTVTRIIFIGILPHTGRSPTYRLTLTLTPPRLGIFSKWRMAFVLFVKNDPLTRIIFFAGTLAIQRS